MPISSQGATFTFPGIQATYTSIRVEEAEPEIVDMTSVTDPIGIRRFVDTGDMKSPAKVTVDYIREGGSSPPLRMAGAYGVLTIALPDRPLFFGTIVQSGAIIESATTEISVGDFVRGQITFMIDHTTPYIPVRRSF
jgi:hypothetical protein